MDVVNLMGFLCLYFQDLPVDELKRRCLEQLEVMSKKRIRRIIAGNPSNFSLSNPQ